MNVDFVVCIIAVLATILTMLSFVPAFCEAMVKNYDCTGKSVIKLLISCFAFATIVAIAFAYPLINATDKTLQSPTKYVGAEIVARGTDGAYIFQEMEYDTGETYRYISTNWLPYDAVYLLTVDKETDEVLVVWKTADDGPRIEAVG
jgi:hypothetical protein